MKLSLRLSTALENACPQQPLWDICCDHGLLGIQALRSQNFPQVHFVDQVPHLISKLQEKIKLKIKEASKELPAFFYSTPAESLQVELTGNVCILGIGAQKIEIFLRAWEDAGLLQADRLILGPHKDEQWFLDVVIPNLQNYELQKQVAVNERGRDRLLFVLNRRP